MPKNPIQAVIIDDEKSARETLKSLIELYCPDLNVIGEGDSIAKGIAVIKELKPDLIFLDVEMPGGTGFDLLKQFDRIEAGVIFTTGHDKYALKAIKMSALDYLLKPIDRQELIDAVAKFQHIEKPVKQEVWDFFRQQLDLKKENTERLVIPSLQGLEIIKVNDILYCEGDRNYTIFHLNGQDTMMVSRTLKEYETLLPSTTFIRVHQKYLVNINFVKRYLKGRGGELIMSNGKSIEVSQGKKQALLDALG